ncbi:MAG TPA: MarR family transcriptional regulator [Mycobacteriales bacterium]|jgi:DNA-binding MarR family transcriptional regulator|nr:MarR family transcriptional regulator [Mycobacteriales bacterium]
MPAHQPKWQPRPEERPSFDAWQLLLEVHAAVTSRIDAALQERAGMPLGWYDVLVHVAEAPDRRIRLRDLEERVLVSQSTVSRLAVRMASAGLVDRSVPAEDRRSVEIRLTREGARRLREARSVAIEIIRQNFAAAVSGADAEHVAAALQAVRGRLAVAPEAVGAPTGSALTAAP